MDIGLHLIAFKTLKGYYRRDGQTGLLVYIKLHKNIIFMLYVMCPPIIYGHEEQQIQLPPLKSDLGILEGEEK